MANDELLLGAGEVAVLWGMSARTVQRMVERGKLRAVQTIACGARGMYLFKAADVVPPKCGHDGSPCMAETGELVCNAAAGHEGPHAAYAGSDLIHQWPRTPVISHHSRTHAGLTERLGQYKILRNAGKTPAASAAEMGVCSATGRRYERWYRQATGMPARRRGQHRTPGEPGYLGQRLG